jgi:hypothetical protein
MVILPGVQIVHAIPGRLRLKFHKLKGNTPLAQEVERRLSVIVWVERVVVNPLTGSVLLLYDPGLIVSFNTMEFDEDLLKEAVHELLALARRLDLFPAHGDIWLLTGWLRKVANGSGSVRVSTMLDLVTRLLAT